MTVEPVRSSTCAPVGIFTALAGPAASIRSPRTMIVWSSRAAAPVPSTTRACVSATTGALTETYRVTLGASGRGCADSADAHSAPRAPDTTFMGFHISVGEDREATKVRHDASVACDK
jgi:hypothetical protein